MIVVQVCSILNYRHIKNYGTEGVVFITVLSYGWYVLGRSNGSDYNDMSVASAPLFVHSISVTCKLGDSRVQ
jgi:hypothetical protein